MNKNQLKDFLETGKTLQDAFVFCNGQDCSIYKGNFEESDEIIYIPDIDLNEIVIDRKLNPDEIKTVIDCCYSGNDFIDICRKHENLARGLFKYVDWQHPDVNDFTDGYDDEAFMEEFGFSMDILS